VDNPVAHSTRFSERDSESAKRVAAARAGVARTQRLSDSDMAKSNVRLFLNCTKNTELTRDPFARTVTFALMKISRLISARTGLGSHSTILEQ
jgi:hypothetical protein